MGHMSGGHYRDDPPSCLEDGRSERQPVDRRFTWRTIWGCDRFDLLHPRQYRESNNLLTLYTNLLVGIASVEVRTIETGEPQQ